MPHIHYFLGWFNTEHPNAQKPKNPETIFQHFISIKPEMHGNVKEFTNLRFKVMQTAYNVSKEDLNCKMYFKNNE